MRRREFLATLGLLPFVPLGCDPWAYVASGDDGSLQVQRVGDGTPLPRTAVARGSYNVQHGAGRVVTPSLDDGTVTIANEGGRVVARTRIAPAAHDACLI